MSLALVFSGVLRERGRAGVRTRDQADETSLPTSPGEALAAYLAAGPSAVLTAIDAADPASASAPLVVLLRSWMERHALRVTSSRTLCRCLNSLLIL